MATIFVYDSGCNKATARSAYWVERWRGVVVST